MTIGRTFALLLVAGAALAGGCGADEQDADREQITAVLDQLFEVQEAGDAATACREVYVIQEPGEAGEAEAEAESGESEGEGEEAEAEGGEAGAEDCEAAFERALVRGQDVEDLSTETESIEVEGDSATAVVHTELHRADGSELTQEIPYDLVRTPEGWRVRISEEG